MGLCPFTESMASETKRQVARTSFFVGFDSADDVIVPLRWAPDCRHKSGLEYVGALILCHVSQRQQVKRASNLSCVSSWPQVECSLEFDVRTRIVQGGQSKTKRTLRWEKKVGATRLRNVDRKRGLDADQNLNAGRNC